MRIKEAGNVYHFDHCPGLGSGAVWRRSIWLQVSAFSFLPAVVRVGPHCGRIARPRFQIECAAIIGQPKLSRALGKCPSAWRLVASAQTANILLDPV